MASAVVSSFLLPHPATLCPPPLQFRKKTHRTTVHKRMLRKPTHSQFHSAQGPLDDIIANIKSDIRESPLEYTTNLSVFDWSNPLKAPSTWGVTPLPVNRAPSDQPLIVRKNRNSRSSASGSSMGDSKSFSRKNSLDTTTGGAVGTSRSLNTTPWPSLDATLPHDSGDTAKSSDTTTSIDYATAQQSLESAVGRVDSHAGSTRRRRPSRLRLFTNGFPRLRRMGTGEASASTDDASESTSPTAATTYPIGPEGVDNCQDINEPDGEAADVYMRKNTHNCTQIRSVMERVARRFPSPTEDEIQLLDDRPMEAGSMPTTLRAAIRIFPEVKMLTAEVQEVSVATEVEGVLHNCNGLANGTIDVVFLIDNGYYVTKECLVRAIDAVNGGIYHMRRGDRLALYTTHCAHNTVAGNKPELHYPLRSINTDTEEIFQDLTGNVHRFGTQTWEPARPNPSMTDVVLGVARSLIDQAPKKGRTHLILLSPAAYVLHDVSKVFPDLSIHRINPAALPFRRELELQENICFETCCRNVFVSNWTSYQSVPGRIRRIMKNARSKSPVGELTNISIDVRARDGCEVIECFGRKDIPHLRLGQVHTVFAKLRVRKEHTQGVDLDSVNPVFNSSLDVKGLRQELQNAAALGAIKVHLLDVQLYHRNSVHAVDCWNYTEAPLLSIRELGGLAPPFHNALEVCKRQYFHKFTQLTTAEAKNEADNLLAVLDADNEIARKVVECLYQEINCQVQIRKYEQDYRQKLPLCPGPIDTETPHEWFLDLWDKKKDKRHGITGVAGDLSSLVEGLERLT